MIRGTVTQNLEAVIPVEIIGPNNAQQTVQAAIDTGFNGCLTLPNALISFLALPSCGPRTAQLADGTSIVLDTYHVTVNWDGQPSIILVVAADAFPLVGLDLLRNCRLTIDVVPGGDVTVERKP